MKIPKVLSLVLAAFLITSLGYGQAASSAGSADQGSKAATAKSKRSTSGKKTSAAAKVDINSATKDQLDALPGVGEAYAQKIIDGRPYNAKNDLVRRNVIPQSVYDGIKDQIIAHRTAKTAGGAASKKSGS
jgi:DNA uptake protein ComE-like DNA-binding protein